NIFA
ncbi:hypothetical protein AVEN_93781-1, partial [Araneus ventricosus]